jgi:hypothetical protein
MNRIGPNHTSPVTRLTTRRKHVHASFAGFGAATVNLRNAAPAQIAAKIADAGPQQRARAASGEAGAHFR